MSDDIKARLRRSAEVADRCHRHDEARIDREALAVIEQLHADMMTALSDPFLADGVLRGKIREALNTSLRRVAIGEEP